MTPAANGYDRAMARAIWSGSISFGLVNVPVKLYTAVEQKDISFHQFEKDSGERIRNKRVAEKDGHEVDYDDIVKGYEVSKGNFVIVTPDELEAAAPEQTKTIDIEDFVDLHEIDPIYFEKTYYLAPDKGAGAGKAYALLRKAMEESEKVAIGRFVMRTKQYLAAVRASGKVLMLETMYFPDEIRKADSVGELPADRVDKRELEMAERLIDSLTTAWKPEKYKDTYREEVLEIIEAKAKGKEIVVDDEAPAQAKVVDLMAALEASLEAARGGAKRTARSSSATKKPAKKATAKRASKSTSKAKSARKAS